MSKMADLIIINTKAYGVRNKEIQAKSKMFDKVTDYLCFLIISVLHLGVLQVEINNFQMKHIFQFKYYLINYYVVNLMSILNY